MSYFDYGYFKYSNKNIKKFDPKKERTKLSDKRGIIVPPNDQKLFCEALKYYIYNHDVMIEPRMNYIKNKFSLLNMVDKTRTTLIKYSQ